jgi:L-threonylcarbamoyladenylate synthase
MHQEIKKTLDILYSGGIILYPTDTIWGIGCDAANEEAVQKIYKIKQREDSKSMLILIDDALRIPSYIDEMPEIAWDLIELSEKPLTIIYPAAKNLAKKLIAEDGSIGIRVSQDKFTQELIRRFKRPIVSTSANISGQPAPAFFDEISEEIKSAVDYVVKHRQDDTTQSAPSGIIKLGVNGEIQVIRE